MSTDDKTSAETSRMSLLVAIGDVCKEHMQGPINSQDDVAVTAAISDVLAAIPLAAVETVALVGLLLNGDRKKQIELVERVIDPLNNYIELLKSGKDVIDIDEVPTE